MSSPNDSIPLPMNSLVTPLLTDLYQLTMVYAFYKTDRHLEESTFELFFRKNPFQGEYTIYCGLEEVLKHVHHFKFTESDIEYLKASPALSHCDAGFWDYLKGLDGSSMTSVKSLKEGTVAFPRIPLLILEGPLGMVQLLETTLLTLVNYPSLVATNASRMVTASSGSKCVEFGLRRAQGPDGGISASRYANIGGFVGTSNVLAGKLFGLNIAGTHAHSFVQAYSSLKEVENLMLAPKSGSPKIKLLPLVLKKRQELSLGNTNDGELAAFVSYACAFPDTFLCLIDTYDTLQSGLLNFGIVASVLFESFGYTPKGVRLDSGDLGGLSLKVREYFDSFLGEISASLDIVASNDITEDVLYELQKKGHAITVFGIGTHLVTCKKQPALGCVYKLVDLGGKARMKLSQEVEKVLIPGKKRVFRISGEKGKWLTDVLIQSENDNVPVAGQRFVCRHAFKESERYAVTPTEVQELHQVVYDDGKIQMDALPTLSEIQAYVQEQLNDMPQELKSPDTPSEYKVMVSQYLYSFLHDKWHEEMPLPELY